MGYRTRQLEQEIRFLKEELSLLKRTVDILERQHVAKTKYGTTLSPFHKDVMPKVETCNGEVEYVDLVKFVIDKQPIEFKMEDKELVLEVRPDGTEIKKVVDKEKKTKYVAPYKTEDTTSWLVEMQRAMKKAGV